MGSLPLGLLTLLLVAVTPLVAQGPHGPTRQDDSSATTWLLDQQNGQRYRRIAIPRVEGQYRWLDEERSQVRLRHGIVMHVDSYDAQNLFVRVYESRRIDPDTSESATPENGLRMEFRQAPASRDRLRLIPADEGLPQSGLWREGFAVADFDGDDRLDLALAPPRKAPRPAPSIYRYVDGSWQRWSQASFPQLRYDYGDVAAADFDRDGNLDLAFAMHLVGVQLLLGNGAGTFTAAAEFPPRGSFSSRTLLTIDWNLDEALDLVAFGEGVAAPSAGFGTESMPGTVDSRGLRVWLTPDSSGGPWREALLGAGEELRHGFGNDLVGLDHDGDGITDMALASHRRGSRELLVHGGTGELVGASLMSLPPHAFTSALAAADFDGDGRDELVVGMRVRHGEQRQVLTAIDLYDFDPSDEAWQRASIDSRSGQAGIWSLAAADLDDSGRSDLIVGSGDGKISLLMNNGDGTFSREPAAELAASINNGRAGCRVRALEVASLVSQELHLIALFAGEASGDASSSTYQPGCENGGRVAVWRITETHGIAD